jgi:hypothetical protein
MPNFDGGHYFLTALIPVANDRLIEHEGTPKAPVDRVRSALARLPTALQSPVTEAIGINSPFARTTRTHLSRFAVIEDVVYNGRDPVDAIKVWVRSANPVLAQPQDHLSSPFLMFVSDFDAKSGDAAELASYLTGLWSTMEAELRDVLQYCVAFESVVDAPSFVRYIQHCQIETTMPFNDYWMTPPPLKSLQNVFVAIMVIGVLAGGGWAGTLGAVGWSWPAALLGSAAGLLVAMVLVGVIMMWWGQRPFPTAPHSDLPSVLKALYLQQRFTRLIIDVQGASDEVIHERFATFVAAHRPGDVLAPSQAPGVVRS